MSVQTAPDLFSRLSDMEVSFILSKLPIRQAVRCSVLSHRWRFLYTLIPQLTIESPSLLLSDDEVKFGLKYWSVDSLVIARAEIIISNILLMHSSDLQAFHLNLVTYSNWKFSCQNVCKWVRIVARKNVQHLILGHYTSGYYSPPAIFCCTSLRTLELANYTLSLPPTHFEGFNHLITCVFHYITLADESLARFISLCPLLQKLDLVYCVGLRKPIISSPNIAHLYVMDCAAEIQALTVNCQNLVAMKKRSHIMDLRVNGVLFYELSHAIADIEMECGSNLVGLALRSNWNSTTMHHFPSEKFVEIIGSFKSLKNLDIHIPKPFPLLNLLEGLPNLERLHIRKKFFSVLERDAIPPCLGYPLANLRVLKVDMWGRDWMEIPVCGCLLQSTPVLETMEIQIPKYEFPSEKHELESEKRFTKLLVKLLDLRRASSRAKICVKRKRIDLS